MTNALLTGNSSNVFDYSLPRGEGEPSESKIFLETPTRLKSVLFVTSPKIPRNRVLRDRAVLLLSPVFRYIPYIRKSVISPTAE